ncbi:TlpA family protein disulfide reductase [Sphingopyxis sp. MWB1]|uniref:TlpA family protein disulfide reductase n=1 Tax=Sphingopyxis sp. MWB1 TaxID=1537715 RepID=UPI001F1641E8|nr:TlpA disulfide reductase family protein [Sphingopyxis sp. MWB1]
MIPKKTVATFALLVGAAIAGCDREKPGAEQAAAEGTGNSIAASAKDTPSLEALAHKVDRSHRGKPAPGARFIAPDDSLVTLAAFRGKPLLVNLWATWCAPCVAEMPTLDALAALNARLHVVVVAQDLQGAEIVDPWFQKAGLKALQPYLDPDNELLDAYNSALPTSIYYDASGRELWRVIGAIDWEGDEARALLAEAG